MVTDMGTLLYVGFRFALVFASCDQLLKAQKNENEMYHVAYCFLS